jgi:hypothetical protein
MRSNVIPPASAAPFTPIVTVAALSVVIPAAILSMPVAITTAVPSAVVMVVVVVPSGCGNRNQTSGKSRCQQRSQRGAEQ